VGIWTTYDQAGKIYKVTQLWLLYLGLIT
jgi:hypothetical protein